jgi:arginine exporter protein ArgO
MNVVVHALLAGLGAGLAVAIPLGAIGVLIVSEGLSGGWWPAATAATGVALVDFGYAIIATAAGTAVTNALEGSTRTIQLTGAAVLAACAARGMLLPRRRDRTGPPEPPAVVEPHPPAPRRAPCWPVLRRFVALTAINPLTAVYFVVLAAGLGQTVCGVRAGAAFAAGVLLGSWSWQLSLAGAGAVAGARLPAWARTATSVVGHLMVAGYAVALARG